MSIARFPERLELPPSLRAQLDDFRRRVWLVKMAEAACVAVFALTVAFLLMFALDRLWDTPGWPRALLFASLWLGLIAIPIALYRWVWRRRLPEQLARLLARKYPSVGDQLLGVIELAHSDSEQARSRRLCEAAIQQVAEDAQGRDLSDAVPAPRRRFWTWCAALPAALMLGLFLAVPDAASNSLARLLAPWKPIPRYTFAAVEPLPDQLVVPHGEPFSLDVRLNENTAWSPVQGQARLGAQSPVVVDLRNDRYVFEFPPQIDAQWLQLRVGDATQRLRVEPTLRPELTSVVADIELPGYLGRPEPQRKDVRGGSISMVKGSRASIAATISRDLADAQVDGQPRRPIGPTVISPPTSVEDERDLVFSWRDALGLSGKEPFTLAIRAREDEPPTVTCEDLPRQKVVLDSEQLAFKVRARDDFGVKRVGLEWNGPDDPMFPEPAQGERILAAGGPDQEFLEIDGTFTAKALGIDPQPIQVRVFAEDYLPGRDRVYSPPYTLYVLNAEQHAIWLTEQLSKWHRHSLEVRDRELQLFETNKQLRDLSPEELDLPETRRRIENQATAERANSRRLSGLVHSGEDLIQQAMRNPEFGVGHLENWAEMLQILKDISANRMPSVADLLDQASQAQAMASNQENESAPMAGQIRSSASGAPAEENEADNQATAAVPSVVDQESSMLKPDESAEPPPPQPPGQPSLSLATTTLLGKGGDDEACPVEERMDEAIAEQQDLLAEFEKIAEELNLVLANLEGSTLVKRLKAASRHQYAIAGRIVDFLNDAFGRPPTRIEAETTQLFQELAEQEEDASRVVSYIMDDMQSYFERRRFVQFKTVLDDMREQDVIGNLRQLGEDIPKEAGLSIAQCEFWSDCLDRWAEDLVDPASGGT